jgi:sortase A
MKTACHKARTHRSLLRELLRFARSLLLLGGSCALAYSTFVVAYASHFQAQASRRFDRIHYGALNGEAAKKIPDYFVEGAPIGELLIPRRGVKAVVVEGVASRDLRKALGHIPGTALPGAAGNVAIAGHRNTFFRPLRLVRPGDTVMLKTSYGVYRYRVETTGVVSPKDTQVLLPSPYPSLTLITCYPFYYIGHAPHRFVVHARQIPDANRAS